METVTPIGLQTKTDIGWLVPHLGENQKIQKNKNGEFYGRNKTNHSNKGKYFFLRCSITCISSVTMFD